MSGEIGIIPVSTTHTITGAIIGVGATTKLSAVRWGVAYRIVWAWLLTIPGTAIVAALSWYLLHLLPLPAGYKFEDGIERVKIPSEAPLGKLPI